MPLSPCPFPRCKPVAVRPASLGAAGALIVQAAASQTLTEPRPTQVPSYPDPRARLLTRLHEASCLLGASLAAAPAPSSSVRILAAAYKSTIGSPVLKLSARHGPGKYKLGGARACLSGNTAPHSSGPNGRPDSAACCKSVRFDLAIKLQQDRHNMPRT